jgi:putative copper resistance protein D
MSDVPLWEALALWIHLAAVALIVGATVAPRLVPALAGDAVRRLTRPAGTVALFALQARLVAASTALVEPGAGLQATDVMAMLGTAWGRGWMVQVCSILAVLLLTFDSLARSVTLRERLAALGACVAAPLTGHAMSFPGGPTLGAGVTALHVLGASLWIGTLSALLLLLQPAELPAALKRFAPVALVGSGALVASGVVASWGTLGALPLPQLLLASEYGRTLTLKLLLVLGIVALGAWHWRKAAPRLAAGVPDTGFRRSAWLEVLLAVAVLAVTAILGLMEPPGHL